MIPELEAAIAARAPRVVLVDCFGTLLHRAVPAATVRAVACHDLAQELRGATTTADLLTLRMGMETRLSREISGPGQPRDFPLTDLAAAIHHELAQQPGGLGIGRNEFIETFCAIETAVEISLTRPYRPLAEWLTARPGTVLALVSDTNLTSAMVGRLLAAHGLAGVFDRRYLSCEVGETKRSGRLYERVLAELHRPADEVLMIGDNPESDQARASSNGITSVLLPAGRWDARKSAPDRRLRRSFRHDLAAALHPAGDDDVFCEMALTLLVFIHRLHASLRAQGAQLAVFLAREGQLLRALFDLYQRTYAVADSARIPSAYLLVSRKATLGATSDEEQRSRLLRLLRPIEAEGGPVQVIDVGWRGGIQDNLQAAAQTATAFQGHYLGLASAEPIPDLEHKQALVFSNQPRRSRQYRLFSHFKSIYEVLLAADHGSVARYDTDETGNVTAVFDEDPAEQRCFTTLVQPLQGRITTRFAELVRLLARVRVDDEELLALAARHHARMMYRPRTAEIRFVERLVHYDNFGDVRLQTVGTMAATQPGNPALLRRHISGGGWPPLRMVKARRGWLRHPYGWYKTAELRLGRL